VHRLHDGVRSANAEHLVSTDRQGQEETREERQEVNYELRDAIRLLSSAIEGSPWTGQLDKYEVKRAADKLIRVAEAIECENAELKRSKSR
jgi:hypothetical protein